MWLKEAIVIFVALALAVVAGSLYGAASWRSGTGKLRDTLAAGRAPSQPKTFDAREIEGLPAPVQRYFLTVLKKGQRLIAQARFSQEGQMNMGEGTAKWNPFTATQVVVTQRAGFDWDARIQTMPGLNVFVHDAYVAGQGILRAKVAGLVPVAEIVGSPEAAQGELLRFLAEAAWYPTRLLPSQGVLWEGVDTETAKATITDGGTIASLEFQFDEHGLIRSMKAAARYRTVKGKLVATPWQGRFWDYETQDGIQIPMRGEVSWLLPDGAWPYWRGRLTGMAYEY